MISPMQCIFIQGQDIDDNILVAHENSNSFLKNRQKKHYGLMAIN